MPSTLTVTNNFDSGAGSLRAEIAAAQSGATIVFAPSLDGQTIKLTSGELHVSQNLTIQGPGLSNLTVSGGGVSRVFEVDGATTTVSLSGLTIGQGDGVAGTAFDGESGGILNFGTLTVSGCDVVGNTAKNSGGGIYNAGTLTVSGSELLSNVSTDGGGIFNAQGGTLKVNSESLLGNYDYGDLGNEAYNDGGGIYNAGTATIANSTLDYDWTDGNTYGGGAIYNVGTMKVTGCTFTADGFLPFPNGDDGTGGIYNASGATLTVNNSVFVNVYPYCIDGSYTGSGNTF